MLHACTIGRKKWERIQQCENKEMAMVFMIHILLIAQLCYSEIMLYFKFDEPQVCGIQIIAWSHYIFWEATIQYIYHEGNKMVDELAMIDYMTTDTRCWDWWASKSYLGFNCDIH